MLANPQLSKNQTRPPSKELTFTERRDIIEDTMGHLPELPQKAEIQALVAKMHDCGIQLTEGLHEFEKHFLIHALNSHKGNACKTAKDQGMHRNTLARTCAELGIVRHPVSQKFCERKELERK